MTIVAGFPGKGVDVPGGPEHGFVVLAADSEESGPVLKSSIRKIANIDKQGCKLLIAGAGGANFIDFAIQEIEHSLTGPFNLTDVRERIEKIVTEVHQDRIGQYPADLQVALEFELLCALWIAGEGVQLVKVGRGFSLILKSPETIGFGEHLARYLIATYHMSGLNLYHSTHFASYLLHEVKKYAMYCGGPSQVVWINDEGKTEELWPASIAQHELSATTVVDSGAKWLLHYVDPMGWGFNLSGVDHAIDQIGGFIKDGIRRSYPHLVTPRPATDIAPTAEASPSPPLSTPDSSDPPPSGVR